jgi:proline iminopeptidase
MNPIGIIQGLAVYRVGEGPPVCLIPYPHGFMLDPMVSGELANAFIRLGRQVISFDPPGAFASTRPMKADMAEMLACTHESLDYCGITEPIDIAGHSMGSLCAIGYALERPAGVKRLILVGTMSGWPAIMRHGRHRVYGVLNPRFWRLAYLGLRVQSGRGSLKTFKQLFNLMESDSYYKRELAPVLPVAADDNRRPIPGRMQWTRHQSAIDYSQRLAEIRNSTMVCVGRHDIETPPVINQDVADAIPDARIEFFESSGHSPFIEEPERFQQVIRDFLA